MAPSPIRILFVDLPRLGRELIVEAIDRQPDMEVVGDARPGDDIGASAALLDADFVIVGLDGQTLPASAETLFGRRGRLKLIGIDVSEGSAFLYRLRPERNFIGALSPDEITSAIRAAAGTV
jgi:hypothetical protein